MDDIKFCHACGQEVSPELVEQKQKDRKRKIKESLELRKAAGQNVGRPKKTTHAQENRICALRNDNHSLREISEKVGVSCNTVQRVCKANGIIFNPQVTRKWDRDEILALSAAGLSNAQISRQLGCHPNTVMRVIRSTGRFVNKGTGPTNGLKYKPDDPDDFRPWLDYE